MRSRDLFALAAALVALGSAGCVRELDWVRVTSSASISTRLAWRTPHELWMFGGPGVLRRIDGAWEELEVCGERVSTTDVTFDGTSTWVLCSQGASATLLRYDAAMEGTTVSPPTDGVLSLATTASGVVLVGDSQLHVWNGTAFDDVGTVPPGRMPGTWIQCAGVSPTELYCGTSYWDGTSWSTVAVDAAMGQSPVLLVRDGAVTYGAGQLVRGHYEAWASPTDRPVVPLTIVGGAVLWGGNDGQSLRLWRGSRGGGPGDYLGSMPGALSTSIYSANDVFVYGIDEGTFVVVTSWAGVGGGGASLYEGH